MADLGSAVVAFSGGVDSAVLLAAAQRALPGKAVAVLAVSPSFPAWEYADAVALASELGQQLILAHTQEVEDPRYARNGVDRCFYCKSALFEACERVRTEHNLAAIVYGAHLDDLGDDRPGHLAATQRGIAAPLITAGMGKAAVRAAAEHYQLRVAQKPALACLSSRFPHGTPIDAARLKQVGDAEHALILLGFRRVRVRFHGELARVELDADEMARMLDPAVRDAVVQGVTKAGFTHVTLDLAGYRMGGANRANARLPLLS